MTALLFAVAALHPGAASADEPASRSNPGSPPAEVKTVEVVVTGTRTPESSQRSTVHTDVVTKEEAERRGATNVGEALQGQLGVQVNPGAYGSLGSPSAIQIQGIDRERVLVLEDGERVIGDVGGAIDLSQIPLSDVSRIEVVAGPTSSLYGTSAIGGVVNILSGAPEREGPSARVRIEGRNRRGLLLFGAGAFRKSDAWAAVDASFQRSDGVLLREGGTDLAVPERSQRLLGLRVGAALGSRIQVQARGRWIHDDSLGRQDQVYPGLGTYRIDLPEKTDRFTLHLSETIALGGGSNVRLSTGRQWAFNVSEKDRFASPLDERRERVAVLSSVEAIATLVDGPARTWVLGARGEVENLRQDLEKSQLSGGDVAAHDQTEVPATTLGVGAVYAQLGYRLHETLTVMPGVRGELYRDYGAVLAPRLAVAYAPSRTWKLRVSGGRGFRVPSAKELGFSFDHSIYGYRVLGNRGLKPEASWGVSGDATLRPSRGITLRAGVFANWIDALIDLVLLPRARVKSVDDYTPQNIGAARTFGAQVDTTFQLTDALRADVGYTYLWTRDDTHEQPLAGRPPHTVSAAMRATLPAHVELVLRYRAVTDAFVDESHRTPGFSTLDARVARPLWPSSLVYAGILNAAGTRKDPDRSGDQRPLDGRTFYVGLTSEFPWESDP